MSAQHWRRPNRALADKAEFETWEDFVGKTSSVIYYVQRISWKRRSFYSQWLFWIINLRSKGDSRPLRCWSSIGQGSAASSSGPWRLQKYWTISRLSSPPLLSRLVSWFRCCIRCRRAESLSAWNGEELPGWNCRLNCRRIGGEWLLGQSNQGFQQTSHTSSWCPRSFWTQRIRSLSASPFLPYHSPFEWWYSQVLCLGGSTRGHPSIGQFGGVTSWWKKPHAHLVFPFDRYSRTDPRQSGVKSPRICVFWILFSLCISRCKGGGRVQGPSTHGEWYSSPPRKASIFPWPSLPLPILPSSQCPDTLLRNFHSQSSPSAYTFNGKKGFWDDPNAWSIHHRPNYQ